MLGRRKYIPLEQMPDNGAGSVARLSPMDLATYTAGWKPGTAPRLIAEAEQRRREQWSWPVRLSLLFSATALIISVAAFFVRH